MRSVVHALVGYIATLVAFVVLDAGWLGLFAVEMFKAHLGSILREQANVGAAIAFYVVYAAGLYALAVRPALQAGVLRRRRRAARWSGSRPMRRSISPISPSSPAGPSAWRSPT